MNQQNKPAVILLAVCAAVDIISAPPLLLASGEGGPPAILGWLTLVLGVLTAVAAVGMARGAAWAKPLALGGRAVDILSALPGLGAGAGPALIVGAVTILSIVTIVTVWRVDRSVAPRVAFE